MYEAHRRSSGKMKELSIALICVTLIGLCPFMPMRATAQAPATQTSPLSPPINHESGRIEEIIAAADNGFRFRAYVLTWRSMRTVVAGAPDESYGPGDNLDVVVYRTEVNGRKVLRFATSPSATNPSATNPSATNPSATGPSATNPSAASTSASNDVADRESTNASASITLGTARVEEVVSAESDGYRFVGYFVTWHDQRVFVVDPQSAPIHAIGDAIDFRVVRTGLGTNQRLSFSL
jgi:hypothetical protein